jgi:hypothetical protein
MRHATSSLPFVLLVACTESNFYIPPVVLEHPVDNKVMVAGGFCAEGANDLESYLKIMFIIDRSNSMRVTDPNNRRISAVREVINEFIDDPISLRLRAGVEIAIISFWGDVAVHTRNKLGLPGFSNDGPKILTSLARTAETSSNTGYDKALATAFQILDVDMARLKDTARARSRYEVFFLSDGTPFPNNCSDDTNSLRGAVGGAQRIKALEALYKVSVAFHTGFASVDAMFTSPIDQSECNCLGITSPPIAVWGSCGSIDIPAGNFPAMGTVTRELLKKMAAVGGGTFKQFRNGDAINFLDFEFAEARRLFAMSNFVTANLTARASHDHVDADSDFDGLTDLEEVAIGTSPYWRDTDGDGFSDGMEWRFRLSGLDPLDPTDGQCSDLDRIDSDGDGLADCEEIFIGTLRRSFDSDADGIPDWVEFQAGGDPNSATPLTDHQMDSDADGGTNAEEMRWHTDPKADDVAERAKIAYDYYQTELPITTGQACYDFRVTNISLASTKGEPQNRSRGFCVSDGAANCDAMTPCADTTQRCDVDNLLCHDVAAIGCLDDADCPGGTRCGNLAAQDGWNRVMLYMAETPYDDPLSEPLYRVACVEPRYVEERDLKIPANGKFDIPARRPSDTYQPTDVLQPNPVRCHVSNNQDCGLDTLWCKFSEDGGTCSCCLPPPIYCTQSSDCDPRCSVATEPTCLPGNSAGGGACDLTTHRCTNTPTAESVSDINTIANGVHCGMRCPQCADGVDNDGDGKTDYPNDPDCFNSMDSTEAPGTACYDGLDNDGDGKTDWPDDPGCDSAYDTDETDPTPLPECSDGLDNDDNGAIDYPADPGCYAASDSTEALSLSSPVRACNDGVDNDGDGLIDYGQGPTNDPGCTAPEDVDEEGRSVCYYCELASDLTPGQCDVKAGHCRAYSGLPPGHGRLCSAGCGPHGRCNTNPAPGSIAIQGTCASVDCANDADCRGGRCDTSVGSINQGQCRRCLQASDCDSVPNAGDGICDAEKGWCLNIAPPAYSATVCATDAECGNKPCDTDLGYCHVDPYAACQSTLDCAPGDICSDRRGFCLSKKYVTSQCSVAAPCPAGSTCNTDAGWCLPDQKEDQCKHSDVCPYGFCQDGGWCDQQSFVFPKDFKPEVDCLRKY